MSSLFSHTASFHTELLCNLLQSLPAGAGAQNADREHHYEHSRCDKGKDADRSKPLKEKRNHEAAEYGGEAAKRVDKTNRARTHTCGINLGHVSMKSIRKQDGRYSEQASERDQPRGRELLGKCQTESCDTDRGNHDLPFALDSVGEQSDEQWGNRKQCGNKETVLQALNKASAAGLHQSGRPIVETKEADGLKEIQQDKHDGTSSVGRT